MGARVHGEGAGPAHVVVKQRRACLVEWRALSACSHRCAAVSPVAKSDELPVVGLSVPVFVPVLPTGFMCFGSHIAARMREQEFASLSPRSRGPSACIAHMARRASMCRAAFHPEPGAIGKMDLRALSASGIVSSREEHLAVEHFSSPGPVGLRVQARLVLCGALAIHGFHRAAMDSRLFCWGSPVGSPDSGRSLRGLLLR